MVYITGHRASMHFRDLSRCSKSALLWGKVSTGHWGEHMLDWLCCCSSKYTFFVRWRLLELFLDCLMKTLWPKYPWSLLCYWKFEAEYLHFYLVFSYISSPLSLFLLVIQISPLLWEKEWHKQQILLSPATPNPTLPLLSLNLPPFATLFCSYSNYLQHGLVKLALN